MNNSSYNYTQLNLKETNISDVLREKRLMKYQSVHSFLIMFMSVANKLCKHFWPLVFFSGSV